MYPGQVIRSLQWPSGDTQNWGRIVRLCHCAWGFPMDQMLQTSNPGSQRTRSFCLMSTMGDKSVHTLIWIRPHWMWPLWLVVWIWTRRVGMVVMKGWKWRFKTPKRWPTSWSDLWGDGEWLQEEEETQEVGTLGLRGWDYHTGKQASSGHQEGIPLFHNNTEKTAHVMMLH